MTELKGCPHLNILWRPSGIKYWFCCDNCGEEIPPEEIVRRWNTRHAEQGWRKYPEEKPEAEGASYWVTYNGGVGDVLDYFGPDDPEWWNVIAFQLYKIPTPYKPKEEKK